MTLPSRQNLDDSLGRIRSLLDKQDLVRGLVHKTGMRRYEVVEDLVAAQYRNVLRHQINHLHPADIALINGVLWGGARGAITRAMYGQISFGRHHVNRHGT